MSSLASFGAPLWDGIFDPALAILGADVPLSPAVVERLRACRDRLESNDAGVQLSAMPPGHGPVLLLSGWAGELRVLPGGRRQIFDFLLPGDVYLPISPERPRGFTLMGLTRTVVLDLGPLLAQDDDGGLRDAIRRAGHRREERRYDAAVRLGQLDAAERTAHLLLELHDRLSACGLAASDGFRLPLSQKHLADALGLSLVQVNRVLKQLRTRALIGVRAGMVTVLRRPQLAALAVREA